MISRCDRCGAAAKEVWKLGDVVMTFCGHHANEHRSALRAKGWVNTEVVR